MELRKTPNSTPFPVNIVGGSTFGIYDKISSAKTYNMFISDNWLIGFAGWKRQYELLPEGQGRGIFRSVRGNFLIVVVNSNVYRLNENLAPTLIGSLSSSSGQVFIDENLASQICIVDGINAYIYNYSLAPNLTIQTLLAGLIPRYVTYHNTFFLFGNGNTTGVGAAWYAYSFATDTTIEQTTQLTLQTKPDYAIAVKRIPGQSNSVLVFGTTVCEIHVQVGGIQNYQRNSTVSIDYGCLSVSTIASSDKYIAWLAVNESNAPTIMIYSGNGAVEISTDGINNVLSNLKRPDKSTGMFYRQDGHLFYQITFYDDADNITLMYDFNTQMFFNLSDGNLNYHPALKVAYFNKKQYFVSLNNASLYESSTNYVTYDENIDEENPELVSEIQRIRICDNIRAENSARFVANALVVTIEQGNDSAYTSLSGISNEYMIAEITSEAILTEAGSKIYIEGAIVNERGAYNTPAMIYRPRVDLSISYDGGVTFGNTVARELNPVGRRKNILTWEKMGAANDMTMKFRFWGNSRWVVNNGILDTCG